MLHEEFSVLKDALVMQFTWSTYARTLVNKRNPRFTTVKFAEKKVVHVVLDI